MIEENYKYPENMSDDVSKSLSSDNIPTISVSTSPKSKSGKKKPRKDSNISNLQSDKEEQNENSLLRKRSKSAIDLSAFTNFDFLTSDSDYRTLG